MKSIRACTVLPGLSAVLQPPILLEPLNDRIYAYGLRSSTNVNAPNEQMKKDKLLAKDSKGLKKASSKDRYFPNRFKLDQSLLPILFSKPCRNDTHALGPMMSSGNYMPEAYINSPKKIKAFVYRKVTEQENAK
jgi:hypothetical protein